MTAFVVGLVLALGVGVFSTAIGLDRDRALYPATLIVIGALYSLFAVMGGSTQALFLEMAAGALFIIAGAVGFRSTLWIVVVGLAGHGLFDFVHARIITNPGVPPFWPAFCGTYDVVAAAYLGWRLAARRLDARAAGVNA